VKAGKDERTEAQDVEVPGLVRAAAPEVYEQADDQVRGPDQVLVRNLQAARRFADDDVAHPDVHTLPPHQVLGLVPRANPDQNLRNVNGAVDSCSADLEQHVTLVYAGLAGGAVGIDVQCLDVPAAIDPDHAVIGQPESLLLLEINNGGRHGCDRQDRQHRRGQLELEFLKHLPRRERVPRDTVPGFVY